MMMEESGTSSLPPGFRFHPTDEELITYYLNNKVSDFQFTTRAVADVDLNKCEPWDLPAKASMGEKEWYFFSLRDRKYPTGLRTNRATEAGYWKTTGKDKEIFRGSVLVGMKKTLVFYRGRAPKGEKTNWVMHEYRLENKIAFKPTKEEWVVCRIFQKSTTVKKAQQTSASSPPISQEYYSPNAMVNELGDIELSNFSNTNNMADISSSSTNIALQQNYDHNNNNNTAMMMMNSLPTSISSSWPLLTTNLSMNSLLLTALQLRGHHQYNTHSFMPPQPNNITHHHQFGSDHLNMASTSTMTSLLDSHVPLDQSYNNIDDGSNIW
ncbi:hypothetical protein BUALT_Bualt02G0076200 [Buddleja alternifolia]|uniref:NAC domain-containing protein n=1 Tax=Buddleja alternifolia TaxID=168488 RepID=A0AAV6Y6A1_9LAMI|nr:hypothetical protein BUALT_Bualt02G0076200 [Buddleja alternifolia]